MYIEMPVISLQIANLDTFDDEYSDAMHLLSDITIDELKAKLLAGTFIKPWQQITSVLIRQVGADRGIPFELTDNVSKFPFDEYIITVSIKRKPSKPKVRKTGSGRVYRRKTARRSRR